MAGKGAKYANGNYITEVVPEALRPANKIADFT